MTFTAMAEGLYEVRAPVPLWGLVGVRLQGAGLKIQPLPHPHPEAPAEGSLQLGCSVGLFNRSYREEIGFQVQHVLLGHAG